LIDKEVVDPDYHQAENDRFYREYEAGQMDIMAFLNFQLEPLKRIAMDRLLALRKEYLHACIEPIITDQARELVEYHRENNAELLIITATNSFITRPIADLFDMYTGRVTGLPSYQEGKVTRLREWLASHDMTLDNSWFYSDSYNDLPLLEIVDHPVAVDPDDRLRQHARAQGWTILDMAPAV
jgi:phosphoserine phosphatase